MNNNVYDYQIDNITSNQYPWFGYNPWFGYGPGFGFRPFFGFPPFFGFGPFGFGIFFRPRRRFWY